MNWIHPGSVGTALPHSVRGFVVPSQPAKYRRHIGCLLLLCILAPLCCACGVSENPLSDPQKSKSDPGLIGNWKDAKSGLSLQLARAGGKLPECVMVLQLQFEEAKGKHANESRDKHVKNAKETHKPYKAIVLAFPSAVGKGTYLNVAISKDKEGLETFKGSGWKPDKVALFMIFKYTLQKDVLEISPMDNAAMKRAINGKKVKGCVAENKDEPNIEPLANVIGNLLENPIQAMFQDTSENVRRLVETDHNLFVGTDNSFTFKRLK